MGNDSQSQVEPAPGTQSTGYLLPCDSRDYFGKVSETMRFLYKNFRTRFFSLH